MVTIDELRHEIDRIDAVIIEKIAKRVAIAEQIGQLKLAEGRAINDMAREEQLFKLYEHLSESYRLSPTFVKQVFTMIIAHSKNAQQ